MQERSFVTVPPAVEPLALADAKLHLRVEITDDDSLITGLIASARMYCETRLRQKFITTQMLWTADMFPFQAGGYYNRAIRQQGPGPNWLPTGGGILTLHSGPLQSVQSVQYVDTNGTLQTIDPSLYLVSAAPAGCSQFSGPGRIQVAYGHTWPVARQQMDSVQVAYTVGYGDSAAAVPEVVRTAMKLLIGHWYENREAVVVGTITSALDMAVDALLSAADHGQYA